jgi:hypothetical protein
MKKLSILILVFVWLQLSLLKVWAGGISLGMTGAVGEKISELDEKVKSQKSAVVTEAADKLGKFEPPDGKILLIVGQDQPALDAYLKDVGKAGGFMFYTSVQRLEGVSRPIPYGGGAWDFPVDFYVYQNMVLQIGLWMSGITGGVDDLDRVANGTYDTNLDTLGDWIKNWARPVYLRVGYEFDNPDFKYTAEKYIWAYKHIVDRFRARGIDNVAYVWHSYASNDSTWAVNWYPGDDYVDWVGISFFNTGNSSALDSIAALAAQHHKPLMIAESTPSGIGTLIGQASWDDWFKPYFDFIAAKKVKAISYINWDWETIPMFAGQGWGNCLIQNNAVVKNNWLTETSQQKYLSSSSTLFHELGYSTRNLQ